MAAQEPNRKVTMTVSLAASFGTLVFLSVATVLLLEFQTARKNTIDLARTIGTDTIHGIEEEVSDQFNAVEQLVTRVARAISDGNIASTDPEQIGSYLIGAMDGLPQLHALAFMTPSNSATLVERKSTEKQHAGKATEQIERSHALQIDSLSDLESTSPLAQFEQLDQSEGPRWHETSWDSTAGESVIARTLPVISNGNYQGTIIAWVGVDELSRVIAAHQHRNDVRTFILHDRGHILAHPEFSNFSKPLSEAMPLPELAAFPDPVLQRIWDTNDNTDDYIKLAPPHESKVVEVGGHHYAILFRSIERYGPRPWIIGGYLKLDAIDRVFERLAWGVLWGAFILLAAILIAILLGRAIARPVRRFAEAAGAIANLDIDRVQPLQSSRIRELHELATAFNSMLVGLRWFNTYVPKRLVSQLLSSGAAQEIDSETRDVTVMFTDIVGFSPEAEGRSAHEVAALLNEHFALLLACIENEDGTLDKFIGDSAMVFWGAPDRVPDHADRALRTAASIQAAILRDNAKRASEGQSPIKVRIGIHTGQATVGNIGAPGRVNYTIVGDMVNVASRVEQLARNYTDDTAPVTVVVTSDTRDAATAEFPFVALGPHYVRGRKSSVELFKLSAAEYAIIN